MVFSVQRVDNKEYTYGAVGRPDRVPCSAPRLGTILYLRSSARERARPRAVGRSFLAETAERVSTGLSECCRFFGPSRAKVVIRDCDEYNQGEGCAGTRTRLTSNACFSFSSSHAVDSTVSAN